MATIRLIPSAYTRSSTSRVTVTNPNYAYDNTSDTSDYAQFRGRNSSSNTYYAFLHGFNFNDVPSNAIVTGFRVLIRCYRNSYQRTGSTYRLRLASQASNSYVISNTTTSTDIGTTVSVIEIPTGNLNWDDIVDYGSGFSIEMVLRPSSNQYPYIYVYGAEIEVTYTISNPRTVTTTLNGNGVIDPSGTQIMYDGDEYSLIVIPTNSSDPVSATKNGSAITLIHHAAGSHTASQAPSQEFTTGFSDSGVNFYMSSSSTGTDWLEYAIGHSAETPYSTSNTNNTYAKPSGDTAWINYHFDFSDIPDNATITSVTVKVYGARENSSIDSTHVARFQCYSGNIAKGSIQNFTSTSNSLVTVTNPGTWTATELQDAQLRFEVGYYGGRMLGITWEVEYISQEYYSYNYIVDGNATIAVTIGGSAPQDQAWFKVGGTWRQVSQIYKKINGTWVKQTDFDNVFTSGVRYKF